MRLLGSIAAVLLLSACNGGAQPPGSPEATGSAPTETAPGGSTTAVPPIAPTPTTTVVVPVPDNTTGSTPMPTVSATSTPDAAAPTNGSCGGRTCGAGETCASYYGIAGPRGPMFHECVIRCRRGAPNDGCPSGRRCYTVADGPGDVCR
ncbi:hypothetical protein [Polyangium jinanense]|uniref:Uncharacterized protein n=1 Tax=Polyangium jinanense TaxID=2829994 RepID=A0A9X3X5F1_9BACT|nr:hypothetical protein [Polyangium jinanense]MDC3958642.1 hypothetical protein [Polyangium jinanense]MDC3983050.1 hypothetical protein [Polyangium jinanense]